MLHSVLVIDFYFRILKSMMLESLGKTNGYKSMFSDHMKVIMQLNRSSLCFNHKADSFKAIGIASMGYGTHPRSLFFKSEEFLALFHGSGKYLAFPFNKTLFCKY